MSSTVTRALVLLGLATLVYYWLVAGPVYKQLDKREREVRSLDQQLSGMDRRLRRLPPVTKQERKAWDFIAYQLEKKIAERPDLLGALVELATILQSSGARVLVASIGNPPKPPETPTVGLRRRAGSRGLAGSDLEQAALPTGIPDGGGRGAATPPTPPPTPLRPRPVTGRRGGVPGVLTGNPQVNADGFETPGVERIGKRDVTYYPVALDVSGPYAAWPQSFNEMTRRQPPVLVNRVEGKRTEDKGEMKMQVVVPTVLAEAKPKPEAPPPFYLSRATATLYGFPAYTREVNLIYS